MMARVQEENRRPLKCHLALFRNRPRPENSPLACLSTVPSEKRLSGLSSYVKLLPLYLPADRYAFRRPAGRGAEGSFNPCFASTGL